MPSGRARSGVQRGCRRALGRMAFVPWNRGRRVGRWRRRCGSSVVEARHPLDDFVVEFDVGHRTSIARMRSSRNCDVQLIQRGPRLLNAAAYCLSIRALALPFVSCPVAEHRSHLVSLHICTTGAARVRKCARVDEAAHYRAGERAHPCRTVRHIEGALSGIMRRFSRRVGGR